MGRGRESEGSTADTARKKPGETAVDRHQNNGHIKAVSFRHFAATSAPRNCCFNCRPGQIGHKDNVHCTAFEEQPEAQLHLPAHDLFSANLRVQLHLPPLDLAWNPACNVLFQPFCLSFCSLTNWITPKFCRLCVFVLINSILLNLLCV